MVKLSYLIVVIAAVLTTVVAGCHHTPPAPAFDQLSESAWRMHAAFMRENTAEGGRDGAAIPSRYWTDPIRALQPIKVYTHRVNVVVVQKISKGVESGIYIYIPISSYLPTDGDDGFTFTPAGESVYRSRRARTAETKGAHATER